MTARQGTETRQRQVQVGVRLSSTEFAVIQQKASAAGVTVNAYMRMSALARTVSLTWIPS